MIIYVHQACNKTFYGEKCAKVCSTNCVDQQCDHVTGYCISCVEGRSGDLCVKSVGSEGGGGGGDSIIPAVIGAVVAVVVITAIIVGFIIWRRRKNRPDEEQEAEEGVSRNGGARNLSYTGAALELDTNKRSSKHKQFVEKASQTPSGMFNNGYEKSSEGDTDEDVRNNAHAIRLGRNTALPVEALKEYILQHSSDSHFKDEFSSIPMANSSPQTLGLAPGNIKKNRYKNIIPYDSSRVLLRVDQTKDQSDYINASYVTGYEERETFIASQAPNDLILQDFVRMIWEQRVDRVVMLSNLVELGKKRCSMYWPVDGEEEFGEVNVRLLTTHVFAQYTIRHLQLSQSKEPARPVTQFHFTAWPDKSVPESPWGLRVMAVPGSGPVLVHCSAGVGRTGTFIALCNLLREAEDTGKMNFLDTLWKLRQDRMHTIQTVAQYVYLHKAALVGHTVAGSTIQVKDMNARLAALESEKPDTKSALSYRREFEAVVAACDATINQYNESTQQPEESVYQNTSGVADKRKNRLSNILPNQAFRPVLIAEAHKEDTYINAVLVPNLTRDNHDLLTQLPLPSTVTDFWRLVTQFNVGLVVAFDLDTMDSDQTIGDFLPKSEKKPFENDRYLVETEPPRESTVAWEFPLTVHQKAVSGMGNSVPLLHKTLTLLACKDHKLDPESVLELQYKIKSCRLSKKSRIIFMCRNGADQCGLMCVQSILLDRLEADQCLAVPVAVGSIKAIRPQVIPTVDQYKCLYRVLKLAHESKNVYGNVGDGSL
ncbi:hypothetical protein RRG08_030492 [Elysia crispata]|uniref:Uncharacterized protein n=1 Tax=Elysia crispata TaxID=231223 RepID=A0AAE1D9A2_9GAST|nr:hypothetical protein RRG08_030492 [Elysia crispata]